MQWQALLRDKRLQLGVAAAAAVGLVVFLRHRNAAGGDSTAAVGTAGGVGNPATLDTTGSDLAAVTSNLSADLQGQLNDFAGQINDALKNIPTAGTPSPKPAPKPAPKPTPHPVPGKKPPSRVDVKVVAFNSKNPAWNSTLSGIAGHYRTSVAALLKLNPSIRNPDRISVGQKIRVR